MTETNKAMIRLLLIMAVLCLVYFIAENKHKGREKIRISPVAMTANCENKLNEYGLKAGEYYISPYLTQKTGIETRLKGYSQYDVYAIQRGCNQVDDYQGWLVEEKNKKNSFLKKEADLLSKKEADLLSKKEADLLSKKGIDLLPKDGDKERWNSRRYIRSNLMNCTHCHRKVGDWKDNEGNHIPGSMGLAVNWTNSGDQYDIYTGILLLPEFRIMQCNINSMDGYKPNIADDIIRDFIAYERFLAAATGKVMGVRYPEQGVISLPPSSTQKHGDDFTIGKNLYNEKCAHCHGIDGKGKVISKQVVFPPLGGPNSFTTDSRSFVSLGVFAGLIKTNMPLGQENSLTPDEARNIATYIHSFPRPAGDKKGVMAAAGKQTLMFSLPKLLKLLHRAD